MRRDGMNDISAAGALCLIKRLIGVQLFGSIGSGLEDGMEVSLEVSDDRGFTYTDMGAVSLDAGDYNARVHWRSLGSMSAPGRLFKITDEGALKRIDSAEMDG